MVDAPLRVLAVVPHPDDESYSMGATLYLAGRAGAEVRVLCATRGELGDDFSGGTGDLASKRSAELVASCAALGIAPPRFLDLPDGGLAELPAGRLEAALVESLQEAGPDVVLALGADGAYGHADHLALGGALSEALAWQRPEPRVLLAAFADGLFLPQWERMTGGLNADLVGGEAPRLGVPEQAVDLRVPVAGARQTKLAGITAHRSQLPDGEPESLFPAGIVAALLEEEWFQLERGPALPEGASDALSGLRE